jgi:putative flippase GtrA
VQAPARDPLRSGSSGWQLVCSRYQDGAAGLPAVDPLRTTTQLLVYGAIGLINTGIDFVIFLAGVYAFGFDIASANIVAWLGSTASSYLLHSRVTFHETHHEMGNRKRIVRYVAVGAIGAIVGTVTVVVLAKDLPVPIAKVVSVGAAFIMTFAMNKLLVFRPTVRTQRSASPDPP